MKAVCASQWVLPGRGDCRRGEGAGQDSVARLGATWSAWFFPTLPSLHSVMNGFLLVCGRGPSLNSILTKAQNTHPSKPASQPVSSPLNTPNHQSTCCRLAASLSVPSDTLRNDLIFNGEHFFLSTSGLVSLSRIQCSLSRKGWVSRTGSTLSGQRTLRPQAASLAAS